MLLNELYDAALLAVWSYDVVLSHGCVTLQHDAREGVTVYLNAQNMIIRKLLGRKYGFKNCRVIFSKGIYLFIYFLEMNTRAHGSAKHHEKEKVRFQKALESIRIKYKVVEFQVRMSCSVTLEGSVTQWDSHLLWKVGLEN